MQLTEEVAAAPTLALALALTLTLTLTLNPPLTPSPNTEEVAGAQAASREQAARGGGYA